MPPVGSQSNGPSHTQSLTSKNEENRQKAGDTSTNSDAKESTDKPDATTLAEAEQQPADLDKVRKPGYSTIKLITMALESSPTKMMSLHEIYQYMMNNFEYFAIPDYKRSWQNSVRSTLSTYDRFQKTHIATDQPGRGKLWTINPHADDTCYKTSRKKMKSLSSQQFSERGNWSSPVDLNRVQGAQCQPGVNHMCPGAHGSYTGPVQGPHAPGYAHPNLYAHGPGYEHPDLYAHGPAYEHPDLYAHGPAYEHPDLYTHGLAHVHPNPYAALYDQPAPDPYPYQQQWQ